MSTFSSRSSHASRRGGAVLLLTSLLLASLTACAPEPGTDAGIPEDIAEQGVDESSWSEQAPEDADYTQTEVPENFPLDGFPLPDSSEITDIGERAPGEWFVVFRTASPEQANELFESVLQSGAYVIDSDEVSDIGDRSVQMASETLSVEMLAFAEEGSTVVSFELTQR